MEAPPAHVFIVEDDLLLASALSAQVEMLGYRIAGMANTAEDAVRGVLQSQPQVVIMGIKDFLRTIAPETKVLAAIRATARKKGKNKLTCREIDREIRSYRRERSL